MRSKTLKPSPERRLAIGDKLDELSDPRPGVGVREIEKTIGYSREVQAIIEELADPDTEPLRRLVLGDKLAEVSDPRPGVGLDKNGLPDIDWVEIPAGEFIYGESIVTKQKLELDTGIILPATRSPMCSTRPLSMREDTKEKPIWRERTILGGKI